MTTAPFPAALPASTAVGLAVLGALLFVIAIYSPLWRSVPDALLAQDALAAAGAVLFVAGSTWAWRSHAAEKEAGRRPPPLRPAELSARFGSSVEVYDPRRASGDPAPVPSPQGPSTGDRHA
jgi:hypothetical protein